MPATRPQTKAVIFDMDGVLVLTIRVHKIAWTETAKAFGLTVSEAQLDGCNGLTTPDICKQLAPDAAADQLRLMGDRKELAFRQAILDAVPLAEGVRELLAGLRQQSIPIAVGSSAPRENVDAILDGGGLRSQFDAVVHADLVERGKPAPDIFLRAAELLDVPAEHCVVVEDAPSGIAAGRAAGMRVLGVASNHAAAELLAAGAQRVAASLAELPIAWLLDADAAAIDRSSG